ncbi:MAG: sulfatase [Thermoanaerobaculia bacterium]|nr:sulfatase [Thermoanaerobaculia bacterium]
MRTWLPIPTRRTLRIPCLIAGFLVALVASDPAVQARRFPNVIVVTVDTLRADHLSSYGYSRLTSPNIDQLLADGARYSEARTIEPLTNPALSSLVTSLYPHQHGSTRNGLPIRPGLASFTKQLNQRGFESAAFVGNWTLKREISGLDEHFTEYREVFSRKRWLVIKGEATAADITEQALEWMQQQVEESPDKPLLLWVHYVEPHAPYRTQRSVLPQLGLPRAGDNLPALDRYDSEIAFVDRWIGKLVEGVDRLTPPEDNLIVFAADHGESLGEHRYWGHGRNLFEPALRIPLGFRWKGRLQPQVVDQPATILDIGPTVLGLIGYPADDAYEGYDWTPQLATPGSPLPAVPSRTTLLQAHKGAVQGVEDKKRARERGLLQIGLVHNGIKEILGLPNKVYVFDLVEDPDEDHDREVAQRPSTELEQWFESVQQGLIGADGLPVPSLDAEDQDRMRSLGYLK